MKQRHADLPVDRKLIYIEPSPEKLSETMRRKKNDRSERPNAVENSLDALVVLPRYETIRQDIESVIPWNANIARLHRVLAHMDSTITDRVANSPVVRMDSVAYDSYWRLRCSGAADQLACRLAESLRVDPASAEGQALRSIIGEWRDRSFPGSIGQQRFLDRFDFDFCERAIHFLRSRLQEKSVSPARTLMLETLSGIASCFSAFNNTKLVLNLNALKNPQAALACWTLYLRFVVDPKFAALALSEPQPKFPAVDGEHRLPDPSAYSELLGRAKTAGNCA